MKPKCTLAQPLRQSKAGSGGDVAGDVAGECLLKGLIVRGRDDGIEVGLRGDLGKIWRSRVQRGW